MSNVVRISNKNWNQRVRRAVARRSTSMGEATRLQRENGVLADPSQIVFYNPRLKP